jgi:hypothetical protein
VALLNKLADYLDEDAANLQQPAQFERGAA